MSNALFDLGEISGETIFIDGTKIEACANKYTFVWKKSVTKNQAKLLIKLADFTAECERLYDLKIVYGDTIKMKHIKKLRKKLYVLKQSEKVVFVHGIGKRKTPLQMQDMKAKKTICFLKGTDSYPISNRLTTKSPKNKNTKKTLENRKTWSMIKKQTAIPAEMAKN